MFAIFETISLRKVRFEEARNFTTPADAVAFLTKSARSVLDTEFEGDDFAIMAVDWIGCLRIFTVEAV